MFLCLPGRGSGRSTWEIVQDMRTLVSDANGHQGLVGLEQVGLIAGDSSRECSLWDAGCLYTGC